MGSGRGYESAGDERRREHEMVATEELLERLMHLPPSPKVNLCIVLLHRALDPARDQHRA
jgi:hypothetical protein